MIQASSLRVGNLVEEEVLGICPVAWIEPNSVWISAKNMSIDKKISVQNWRISIENLNPIPLTPEKLLKAGFEYSASFGDCKWTKGELEMDENYNRFISDGESRLHYGERLQFIHQIQNWAFSHTGEELIIEL